MAAATASTVSADEHRLPLDVKPIHYDLTIRTDLEKLEFDGWVSVTLNVQKETSRLVFHSSGLILSDIVLHNQSSDAKETPVSQTMDTVTERAIIDFPSTFVAGSTVVLQAKFQGPLTADMMGYYRSSWKNEGKEEYYSLTQFAPTAARRGFPCWDEPLLKATYSISLISRSDSVNLSNMDVISEEPYLSEGRSGEWKITRFSKSPPMSTYLVAYANGPFAFLESSYVSPLSGKKRPLRIYATRDNIHQAQFALDVKQKVLPLYEKMFDIEYPLPKLDTFIANDFDIGAMENWGLITGRTTSFCLDPTKVGVAAQKRVAIMESHEVSHMWFGNITTMAWWDNIYLNEGFATLMGEIIMLGEIFPEWNVHSAFINGHLSRALSLDAKLSSHPIEVECPDANQINQIFDSLSYSKAASVLRMLASFIGEEVFLQGVTIYLKDHLFGSSVSNDLWEGVSKAAKRDVTSMMSTWVSKMGFPVITVKETPNSIIVRQDRFLETGRPEEKDNQTIWEVPLNIMHVDASGKRVVDRSTVLRERETVIPLDTSKPFKLNTDTTAVCRVLYTPERLSQLAQEAVKKDSLLTLNDRLGLVHDVFALAKAGYTEISTALGLVDNLRKEEEDYLVWQGMKDQVDEVVGVWWEDDHIRELFDRFRRVYSPIIAKLGYDYKDDESSSIKQLRTLAVAGAAAAGDPTVIEELQRRFNHMLETGDDSGVALDLEITTYSTAVRYGGKREYEAVKAMFENPRTPTTRQAAIAGLCSAQAPELVDQTFSYILTDVKDQDYYIFFAYLSGNRKTTRRVASFFEEHYDDFYERFSKNMQLNYLVSYAFKSLASDADLKDVEGFFKDKNVSKFDLVLRQTLDNIRSNAALIKRSTSDVVQYLEGWTKEAKA
ncbi:hypothetical protein SCHPADRAFT_906524 [Schizopora paradoxa]|uniref:Aminopeptidase n=1 Tax=Schizopora paradoxa TaxID=27342 RepID=A0A0H2S1H2_9AGAM|nr:hypothetical protein SCHPADRAFT_906524 [Schizopora paradoxa]